jgi:hypothetical protein
LQEAEKRQKIRELMLDSTIFSVITHALLTENQPVDKACRITETPRSAQIAQLVEQRIENPRVRGSNPRLGTTLSLNKKTVLLAPVTGLRQLRFHVLCSPQSTPPWACILSGI